MCFIAYLYCRYDLLRKQMNYSIFDLYMYLFTFICSTFVCPTEIISFSDKVNEFHDINCEVVGVSVDSHFTHLAWINTPRKVLSLWLATVTSEGSAHYLNPLSLGSH